MKYNVYEEELTVTTKCHFFKPEKKELIPVVINSAEPKITIMSSSPFKLLKNRDIKNGFI